MAHRGTDRQRSGGPDNGICREGRRREAEHGVRDVQERPHEAGRLEQSVRGGAGHRVPAERKSITGGPRAAGKKAGLALGKRQKALMAKGEDRPGAVAEWHANWLKQASTCPRRTLERRRRPFRRAHSSRADRSEQSGQGIGKGIDCCDGLALNERFESARLTSKRALFYGASPVLRRFSNSREVSSVVQCGVRRGERHSRVAASLYTNWRTAIVQFPASCCVAFS